jgi:hypothetical protein
MHVIAWAQDGKIGLDRLRAPYRDYIPLPMNSLNDIPLYKPPNMSPLI